MIPLGSVSPVNIQRMQRKMLASRLPCMRSLLNAVTTVAVVADRQVACRTMSELSELKLRYRDLVARGLDQELANRDLEIVRLNAALADRDHGIVSLNAALAARDCEIERLTTRISGRHARVRLWRACPAKDMCASGCIYLPVIEVLETGTC